MRKYKSINELNFGFADAENYRRRENRQLFNQSFVRTPNLDHIVNPSTSFILGEKGTGKTAYALQICETGYKDSYGNLRYIRETDYQQFVRLKAANHLSLSGYCEVWKVIISLLLAFDVTENPQHVQYRSRHDVLDGISEAIREYYAGAFSPEIVTAMRVVENTSRSAELFAKWIGLKSGESVQHSFEGNSFQINLHYIFRQLHESLKQVKLKRDFYLFVDGIDIRPLGIPYDDYLECIKGLANAVWELNNDVFPPIKGSQFRFRVVLLLRPDILLQLGLQNTNAKIRDNSVFLDWRTTYRSYESSELFHVSDRILSTQQGDILPIGQAWNHYFPFDNIEGDYEHPRPSFVSFLRFSFYRPRDILTMMKILQEQVVQRSRRPAEAFTINDFNHHDFRKAFTDYLLAEVRDQLTFYYTDADYQSFLRFFTCLDGKFRFTYSDYQKAYNDFVMKTNLVKASLPAFAESADLFLQFLYTMNVICFEEELGGKLFTRWSFRERTIGKDGSRSRVR